MQQHQLPSNRRVASAKAKDGGGVVGPGRVDADVAAEGGEGPVAGLVGDDRVAGAAEVGVGDETGAEAVSAVPDGARPTRATLVERGC